MNIAHNFDVIDCNMENEENRLLSFQRNAGWRGKVDPRKLAAAGFYYIGVLDHVKCFACDLTLMAWEPDDDPFIEHFKNQPKCSFISNFSRKYSVSIRQNTNESATNLFLPNLEQSMRDIQMGTVQNYRPLSPVSYLPRTQPNYSKEHARLHTFINWPKYCPVRPKELIDAGFYYTGYEDQVQCFKCGIILAGWEPQDTPWGEHEKWAKDCPLVIEHCHQRNPHIAQDISTVPMLPQEQTWKTPPKPSVPHATIPQVIPNNEPEFVKAHFQFPTERYDDSNTKVQISSEKSIGENQLFYLAQGVQKLLEEGSYDLSTIQEAISQRKKIDRVPINSMNDLMEAVELYHDKLQSKEKNVEVVELPAENLTKPELPVSQAAINEQMRKLEDAHRCKICLDAEIGIVFLPCGHLVCCPNCAQEIRTKKNSVCPICRQHITDMIRSYLT